jgi:hypothetical protein
MSKIKINYSEVKFEDIFTDVSVVHTSYLHAQTIPRFWYSLAVRSSSRMVVNAVTMRLCGNVMVHSQK